MRIFRTNALGGLSLALSCALFAASAGEASAAVRTSEPADVSSSSFTSAYSAMSQFRALASAGHGKIAAIMPDTVSSTRYTGFDQPDITQALTSAGLSSSQFVVQNALGSDANQLTDAQTDIANGATVLLLDPLDSGVGTQIEVYAKQHGVNVIDYDNLTLGGTHTDYVGFNDIAVGKVMGQGLVKCVAAWHISKPRVVVMRGSVIDNNASLFAQGYDSVLQHLFSSHKWTLAARTDGTWDPPTSEAEFQSVYSSNHNVNTVLVPNDETGAPIIAYLQSQHVKPRTFPITGQDATLTGLDNVLAGYQCGTVYKPIYLEAQAAVAVALYLRAGEAPPKSLVNGTMMDTTVGVSVPSVLIPPTWVTTKNMNATVVKDHFVPLGQLCAPPYRADCAAAHIR